MDEPQRRHDPLALAVIGGAVLVLVALVVGLVLSIRSAPPAPAAAPKAASAGPSLADRIGELTRQVAKEITDAVREDRPMKMPGTTRPPAPKPPVPKAQAPAASAKASPAPVLSRLPGGMTWTYRVDVEPPAWRDVTLAYRTVEQVKGMMVYTEFRHAGGKSNFTLGTFEAGHASHAATRFPGFFMYAAYLDKPLAVGQRYRWEWPWQLPDRGVRPGRVKRYEGTLVAWEGLKAAPGVPHPGGVIPVARIEGQLSYVDGGKTVATAKETLWVAPRYAQVVKVVREGRTPDESSQRIVAELVEFR
jgi:hypothetical protein